MSEEDTGRRWYDPNRTTLVLGGLVLAFVAWWGTLVYGMARAAELANVRQDAAIVTLEAFTKRVDEKIDRLLERK